MKFKLKVVQSSTAAEIKRVLNDDTRCHDEHMFLNIATQQTSKNQCKIKKYSQCSGFRSKRADFRSENAEYRSENGP